MRIIYDKRTGAVLFTCVTNQEPKAIDIEIPEGKILQGIDISGTTAKPIFSDKPMQVDITAIMTELNKLKDEILQTQIGLTEALEMVAPIVSED